MKTLSKALNIKNMVCPRCIEAIENIFEEQGAKDIKVELGKVVFFYDTNFNLDSLNEKLINKGFEIVENDDEIITEKIKLAIIKLIFYEKNNENLKNSVWLENELQMSYQKLSKSFIRLTHTTIEKYIILQKIERVKELISYNNLSLKEIAKNTAYKHVSHLSKQFKEIEGLSISEYKKTKMDDRKFLDNVL